MALELKTDSGSDGSACSAISRLESIARAAVGHPRFGISSIGGSVHIALDGWDVGTYEKAARNAGLNGTQVDLAEVILGLPDAIAHPTEEAK